METCIQTTSSNNKMNKTHAPITTKTRPNTTLSSNPTNKPVANKIMSKEDLLMKVISRFYSNKTNLNKMLPILLDKAYLSLRDLDHLVTSYAKRHGVMYDVNGKPFLLYQSYKSQLRSYTKQYLDPFKRGTRIGFIYDGVNELETTVGQLNFIKFCIQNDILDYAIENLDDIKKDMNELAARKDKPKRNTKKSTLDNDDDENEDTDENEGQKIVPFVEKPVTEPINNIEDVSKLPLNITRTVTKHHTKITVTFK
jgi:hypothetical protein